MTDTAARPNMDEYFMGIALAVRSRANCQGNRVGALIVKNMHIISTGYNGTPHGMTNCLDGGCYRCEHPENYPTGTGYDLCICVHAEQNAILAAARFGINTERATLFSTMRPCFGCTKEALQARISTVIYLHEWSYPDPVQKAEYERLQNHFPGGIHQCSIPDPDVLWATSALRRAAVSPR